MREDVATTVALLRYMRVFSSGEEINPLTAEIAARYDRILEKIDSGVPLAEIIELHEIAREVEEAEERRRIFRDYKKRLRTFSALLASQPGAATRAEVTELLKIMEGSPLLGTANSLDPTLSRLIEIFKKHPHLAYEEHINCRYIRHLVATDFADELYVLGFFESLRIRHAKAEPTFRFHNGYSFDFPQLVARSGGIFCFTGKFLFGSRRNAVKQSCRKAEVG